MRQKAGTLIVEPNKKRGKEKTSMKKFETPVIEVTKFDIADVITTSTGGGTVMPDDEV